MYIQSSLADNQLRINYAAGSSESLLLDIVSLSGKLVYHEDLSKEDYVNTVHISTNSWNPGVYIARMKNLDQVKSIKFVVN